MFFILSSYSFCKARIPFHSQINFAFSIQCPSMFRALRNADNDVLGATVLFPPLNLIGIYPDNVVSRNIEYIMSTTREDGQIRCLHGLRFVSMSWVIFGHTYYYICTSLTTGKLLISFCSELLAKFCNYLLYKLFYWCVALG